MENIKRLDSIDRKRLEYVDISKCIGIILVVIGHCINKNMSQDNYILYICRLIIYTIHMPLFFIVSGILFKKNIGKYKDRSIRSLINNKIKIFIVPYISFSVINYIMFEIMLMLPKFKSVSIASGYQHHSLLEFITSVLTLNNVVDDHLWFIYVMFLIYVFAFTISKVDSSIFKSKNDKLILFVFLFILYELTYWVKLPELIFKTIRYGFLFYIGYNFNNILEYIKSYKFICNILFVVLFIAYITVDNLDRSIKGIILPILEIYSSYLLIELSKCILKVYRIKEVLSYIGMNSYPIYLLHQPFIVNGLVFILLYTNFSYSITIIIASILGCIIPLIINKTIIQKNKILKFYLLGNH